MRSPAPENEPILSYAPGAPERAELKLALDAASSTAHSVPCRIGGDSVTSGDVDPIRIPHRRAATLGNVARASEADVDRAIEAAMDARSAWAERSLEERAAIFLRAADLLAGPWRARVNAATMLGQSKTAHQAEIDAACELIDFLRFNVADAFRMANEQPYSPRGVWNRTELRPLDGFVLAVTPFNFTAIAGNLPTAPAILGNTVVWKPSPNAVLSNHLVMEALREAGLPDGVINQVFGDAPAIVGRALADRGFAGLHFTGSTAVFRQLWRKIADHLDDYACYPRIVGESGGKDFIVAHPSADREALGVAILRGGYEFQGQKCSAVSRVYVPRSVWKQLEPTLVEQVAELRMGDPTDFRNFMAAVIDERAFEKIRGYLRLAEDDAACRVVAGGGADGSEGWFVEPTLVECSDPRHRLMSEEIFGPVVAVWAYDDDRYEQALELCDATSPYALTGAVFARDRDAVALAHRRLRHAAGNFYVNDKPTGSIVGQQPFGGSRASGTNDKAGSPRNLWRWVSTRTIKETFVPPMEWRYPFMDEE